MEFSCVLEILPNVAAQLDSMVIPRISLPDLLVCVGTKGVSQNHHLSFDNNKVLKIINWIC